MHQEHLQRQRSTGQLETARFALKELYCACCADELEHVLSLSPHIKTAKVDFHNNYLKVAYHPAMISQEEIGQLISTSACCTLVENPGMSTAHMHHLAQLSPITLGTKHDRMQYEMAATSVAGEHEHAHHEAAATEGMSHDMSDPVMAKAMERDMRDRFLLALALTIPTVLYSPLAADFFGLNLPSGIPVNWLMLITTTPIVWWSGWIFIGGAYKSLKRRSLNMSVLIATGVLAAYLFSVSITLLDAGETFFEAAAMLVTFVLFGHWMEMKSRRGTTDALRALFDLVPPMAKVLRRGEEIEIPTSEIVVGDRVVLKPGDKVPVDGVIEDGETSIDESLVTGESIPVDKKPGDELVGGSINQSGAITLRATKIGADTALGQIVKMVEEAQNSKAPGQRIADRAAQYLVVLAVGSGLLTFILWYLAIGEEALTSLTFAISAVVIACPDALGLATPTAVAIGTGLAAKHNVLIKDAATLEGVSRIDIVVLDKTGTLTEGKPRLTEIHSLTGDNAELLRLVASAEEKSEHSLARAIVEEAKGRSLRLPAVEEFRAIAGKGLEARVEDRWLLVGNRALMVERGTALDRLEGKATQLATEGNTPMYVAIDGVPAGIVAVADTIRPTSKPTVDALKSMGIEVVMITGDNTRTAEAVARQLGIARVFAEVLPADKARYVRQLQEGNKQVAMVGDGVNDAPALAQANIGIAIGAGTDVAIETARVVLTKSDPADIVRAFRLSKATVTKMKQNLFWASIYNILAIPVAAGALYPSLGLELRPEWSALLMSLSSIIVATNAVLLKGNDRALMKIEESR